MHSHSTYFDHFIDALRFLTEINADYRNTHPDFSEIEKAIRSAQSESLRQEYAMLSEKILAPFARNYVERIGSVSNVAHSCHSLSDGFLKTWRRLEIAEMFPLAVTVGNVYYKNENIYGLTKSTLKKILEEGKATKNTLDVHVWLTWDNLSVLDLTVIPSLIEMGKLSAKDVCSPILIWSESEPGDFVFDPILVDNDFFSKVDSGSTTYLL